MSSFDGRYLTDFSNHKDPGFFATTRQESRCLRDHERGLSEGYTAPPQGDPGKV